MREVWRKARRWVWGVVLLLVGLCFAGSGCEYVLEQRARARFTAGESFVDVGDAHVRYLQLGAGHPGATVVFLTGLGGSIEQMYYVQTRLAETVPTLSYDRGGYGLSVGSRAHTAGEQVTELEGVLDTLGIRGRIVLVSFSSAASIARIFAARYPARMAGMYLIEPYLPEIEAAIPGRKPPRRQFIRWIVHDLVTSTLGLKRLANHFSQPPSPNTLVEWRAREVLQSRPHFWALAREWYVIPESARETLGTPVGQEPVVILYTEQQNEGAIEGVYTDFLSHSTHGKIVKLPNYDHSRLLMPGPVLDTIVKGVAELATAN